MSKTAAAGFTLIEILVAFAILALGLTLLLGTLSGASRQLRQAGDAGIAALHAQTLLDARASVLQRPGRSQGELEDGRYRWQLQVTPWQAPQVAPSQAQAPHEDPHAAKLLHVQLDIQWGDAGPQQRLRVNSLRLVLPPAEGSP